jgi:hypothetical protein
LDCFPDGCGRRPDADADAGGGFDIDGVMVFESRRLLAPGRAVVVTHHHHLRESFR